MTTKKAPKAHYCDEHGVIVHRTHDVEVATKLARDFEMDRLGLIPGCAPDGPIELPDPVCTWLRTRPARPDEQDAFCISFWYDPGQPGARGTFAAVEFSEDGRPIGRRVEEST